MPIELGDWNENRSRALQALAARKGMGGPGPSAPGGPPGGPPAGQGPMPGGKPPASGVEGKGSEDMTDEELAEAGRAGRLHLGDHDDEIGDVGGRYLDHLLKTGQATDRNGQIDLQDVNENEADLVHQYLEALKRVRGVQEGPHGINPDGSPK